MPVRSQQRVIQQSERHTLSTLMSLGAPSPQQQLTVLLQLRRRSPLPPVDELGATPIRRRAYLPRESYADRYGVAPDDLALTERIAASCRLRLVSVNLATRLVRLSGTVADIEEFFGVQLAWYRHPAGITLSHLGPVSTPAALNEIVEAVYGLDTRPVAAPQLRTLQFDPLPPALRALQQWHYGLDAALIAQSTQWQQALDLQDAVRDLTRLHTASPAPTTAAAATPMRANALLARGGEIATQYGRKLASRADDLTRRLVAAYVDSLGLKLPTQMADLYQFPSHLDGAGQCIGVLQFGGGLTPGTLATYFGLLGVPAPAITVVPINGATNQPGVSELFDTEVALDIEIAGAVAPGAALAVYFAPLTEAGFIEAFATAIHDQANRPSVLTLSWALSEREFIGSPLFVQQLNELFKEAALLGVTTCVASGDQGFRGSTFGAPAIASVDFPGSSPYALACGGTRLVSWRGFTVSETVWNDLAIGEGSSGGGISEFFAPPPYQRAINLPSSIVPGQGPGRGVPDVCGNGDPLTGYFVLVNGRPAVAAGTSSVAPLWAGLVARLNQGLGQPCGFLNPLLYNAAPGGEFRDITIGNNGGYVATKGWDACTGLGSPNGTALLELLARE